MMARLVPAWIKRRIPRPLKRWLLAKYLGYARFDFDDEEFDETASADDVYYGYRLLLGRLPDRDGWKTYEAGVRGRQMSVATLVSDFLASPEFLARRRVRDGTRSEPVLVDLGTFKMYVLPDDFDVGHTIIRNRPYEPHVGAVLARHLRPGSVFVDLGAYVGYFSLMAAAMVGPSGRVLSFEPSQPSYALLLLSASLNGFANIEVFPFAVAEARRVVLVEGRESHRTVVDFDGEPGRVDPASVTVSMALDDVLRDLDRLDLIKMDIEGGESRALRGATKTLAAHRPVIVSEFSPTALQNFSGVSGEEYLQQLVRAGYALFVIEDEAGSLRPCGTDTSRVMSALARHPSTHIDIVACPR